MRTTYITTGLMTFVLVVALGLPAAAQTSASPSPQATPSQTAPSQAAPQQEPQTAPSQAPQQEPSQSAPAQQPPAGQSGAASQSQAPSHNEDDNPLNLTEEQKTKLRPIIADENQQMEAVRNDSSLTTEQKVAKANQIRETASPKIKAVLTPEQLQKLAEMQQKARQQQQSSPSSDTQKPQN
jgi:periplasmic protein CpxP/Spy